MNNGKKALGAVAAGIGAVGLLTAGVALAWIAASLGVSVVAATQVLNAIMAGGVALAIVMAAFGGGIISAIVLTVRQIAMQAGRNAAIA
ncbi:uberolysin/carnocyclin family circular bacteriocin [Glycomyces sp. A-F 0318]|uniref:uberolysin/carnocyclin family circular bacteriocin n=1 Tax=Glycomyces amatae TaxID=2881355 RepID=UPI001E408C3C|nr:uberolysin/carnocyclin family circular bacteriocin [Glycomyces amatae]MCD0445733.1 uberolysin/carnocyclin family circular bacteriocin [Glycomyces amatae]